MSKSIGNSFSVSSYNVLAETFRSLSSYYHDTSPANQRYEALAKRLQGMNSSIFCLQECDPACYALLRKRLADYDICYAQRGSMQDGCAVLYRKSEFKQLLHKTTDYQDGTQRRLQEVTLQSRMSPLFELSVFNTHIQGGAKNKVARDHELNFLTQRIQGCKRPVVVCGDFNLTPSAKEMLTFQQLGLKEAFDYDVANYPTSLSTFNGSPMRIDYVMHSKLAPIKSLYLTSGGQELLAGQGPSDHLPLGIEFELPQSPLKIRNAQPGTDQKPSFSRRIVDAFNQRAVAEKVAQPIYEQATKELESAIAKASKEKEKFLGDLLKELHTSVYFPVFCQVIRETAQVHPKALVVYNNQPGTPQSPSFRYTLFEALNQQMQEQVKYAQDPVEFQRSYFQVATSFSLCLRAAEEKRKAQGSKGDFITLFKQQIAKKDSNFQGIITTLLEGLATPVVVKKPTPPPVESKDKGSSSQNDQKLQKLSQKIEALKASSPSPKRTQKLHDLFDELKIDKQVKYAIYDEIGRKAGKPTPQQRDYGRVHFADSLSAIQKILAGMQEKKKPLENSLVVDLQKARQYDMAGEMPPACSFHAVSSMSHITKNFDQVCAWIDENNAGALSNMQRGIILREGIPLYQRAVQRKKAFQGGADLDQIREFLPPSIAIGKKVETENVTLKTLNACLKPILDHLFSQKASRSKVVWMKDGNDQSFAVITQGNATIIFDSHTNEITLTRTRETTQEALRKKLIPFLQEMDGFGLNGFEYALGQHN